MKHRIIYPITSAQIDAQYRLTVDGILTFHENTVADYFTSLNAAAFDVQKEDKTWVISEINLELPAPPTMWTESIEMTTWISELTPMRAWLEFEARERHSGVLVARGYSCWSLISMSERKLVPCQGYLPETEVVKEYAAGPHRKHTSMHFADTPVATLGHTINRIDLDFNGHTNNRRYVQMALVCFDEAFLQAQRPDFLNIRFVRESRLGEHIANYTYPTEDPKAFVGQIKNGAGEEICRVSSHWTPREPLADIAEVNLIRHSR